MRKLSVFYSQGDNMKRLVINFLIRFSLIFVAIIIFGIVYKPSDVNFVGVIRALVIASGGALSWAIGEYVISRRLEK
jgi:hypothetical protein